MKLSVHEQRIWRLCCHKHTYPRWGKYNGGFVLYVSKDAFMEEAIQQPHGRWSVGRKSDDTERTFYHLEDALCYGEILNFQRELSERQVRLKS